MKSSEHGNRRQSGRDLVQEIAEIDEGTGINARFHLQPRQREQIINQPRHPLCLRLHDVEELVARPGVVARRAAQRLDKASDGGQRRSQFMAGIGDEVGTHAVDTPRLALVLERQYQQVLKSAKV